ncbi:hypothetical protein PG993_010738 [Apiospora rasikravindrae]|uniref:Chromo domain-containing protein n=1 Tax=Apiospora rasikravindrae TaxID=990691 RepID=A0ABR1SC89_9PEZI
MVQEQGLPPLEAPIVLSPNIGSLDASNDSLHTVQEPLDHRPLTSPWSPTQARQFSPTTRSRKASSNTNPDNVFSNPAGAFALPVGPLSLDTNRQALLNDETSDLFKGQFSMQQMDTSGSLGCSTSTSADYNVSFSERTQDQVTEASNLVESSANEFGLPIQSGTKRSSQEDLEPSDSSSNGQLSPAGCGDHVLEDHVESRAPKRQKMKAANDVLARSVCHKVQLSTISLPITLSEEASQELTNEDKSQDSDNIQNCPSSFRYSSANPEPGMGAEYRETPFSGVIKRTTIGHDTYYSLEFKSNALSYCFPEVMSLLASTSPAVAPNAMANAKTSSSRERYTAEDDEKIIRLKQEGLLWDEIAEQFPGRSSNALYVRYMTKLKGTPRLRQGRRRSVTARRRKNARQASSSPSATESENDGNEEWPLTKITKSRTMQGGNVQYRVWWKDGAKTWEPYDNVKDTRALEEYESSRGSAAQREG